MRLEQEMQTRKTHLLPVLSLHQNLLPLRLLLCPQKDWGVAVWLIGRSLGSNSKATGQTVIYKAKV